MKTKVKRLGKSSLSVVLSIMMLLSTMIVGEIGTIEAGATISDTDADNLYICGSGVTTLDGNTIGDATNGMSPTGKLDDNTRYFDVTLQNNGLFIFYYYGAYNGSIARTVTEVNTSGKEAEYDCNYNFKFTGSTGKHRVYFQNQWSASKNKERKWTWTEPLFSHTVDYVGTNASHGTATVSKTYAANNEKVTLTITPDTGYIPSVTVRDTSATVNTSQDGSNYVATYTNAGANVVFDVAFSADTTYTNTITEVGATGSIDYTSRLTEGATSTVTVTPPSGYGVYDFTARDASGNNVACTPTSTVNQWTYKMPESNVTATVTYKALGDFYATGAVKKYGGVGDDAGWNTLPSEDFHLFAGSGTTYYRDLYLTNNSYFKIKDSSNKQYCPTSGSETISDNGTHSSTLNYNSYTGNALKYTGGTGNRRMYFDSSAKQIWVKSLYTVTANVTGSNGTAAVETTRVGEGDTAQITLTPAEGYYPQVTVGGSAVGVRANGDGTYTAETTAGSANVTFNVSFVQASTLTDYTNTAIVSGLAEGVTAPTITFNPSTAKQNAIVEMTVPAVEGYAISGVSFAPNTVSATVTNSGTSKVYSYVMPSSNVTATVTYAKQTIPAGRIYFDNSWHWYTTGDYTIKVLIQNSSGENLVLWKDMTLDSDTGLYYYDFDGTVQDGYKIQFKGERAGHTGGDAELSTSDGLFKLDADDFNKVYAAGYAKDTNSTGETPDEYLNITIPNLNTDASVREGYVFFKVSDYTWSNETYYANFYSSDSNNPASITATSPGKRMKKVAGETYLYALPITSTEFSKYDKVIFSDGVKGNDMTEGATYEDGGRTVCNQYAHRSKTGDFNYNNNKGQIWTSDSGTIRENPDGSTYAYIYRNGWWAAWPEPDVGTDYIRVYAKTGTIRSVSGATTAENGTYDKYSYYSSIDISYCDSTGTETTTVTDDTTSANYMKKDFDSTLTYTVDDTTYYRLLKADVKRNRYIKVTLTIHDSTAQNTYYVRGFNVNGKTYGEYTEKTSNNQYSFVYEVKDETVPIEITPVYFYQNDSNCINFEVEQFDTVESVWGNTVACYAYYVNGSNIREHETKAQATLGGYPGQPLLNHQGIYFTQIPKTDAKGGKIKGITLNNYVWDAVHGGDLIGYSAVCGEGSDRSRTARNAQTYDYDDFVALANVSDVDTIIFNFKYRTWNQNGADSGNNRFYTSDKLFKTTTDNGETTYYYGNEWNGLVDISNVPVDLFGNKVEVSTYKDGAYNSTTAVTSHDNYTRFGSNHHYFNEDFIKSGIAVQDKVYIVSDGYVNYYSTSSINPLKSSGKDYLGEYATMWYVYTKDNSEAQDNDSTYTLVGKLPPSAFVTDFALESSHFISTTVNGETVTILNPNLTGDNIPTKFLQYTKGLGGDDTQYSTGDSARNAMWTQYANIYNAANGMPAVITYESSLTSKGRDGATENPGNRSDGRWYYSRSTDVIPVTADIQVWIKQSDGTYVKDTLSAPGNATTPVASTIVGAAPHFTNDSSYKGTNGNAFTNLNKATVRKANDKDFTFTTDGYKVGSDYTVSEGVVSATANSTATYTFVGWYLNLDGDNLSEITTTSVSADKSMAADSTLVAVYEKVDTTAQTLVVSHELYANAPALTTAKADSHNGSGTPHVQIVITDASGNTLKTYSDTTGSYQIKVENESLLQDTTNKVKIILTTETDSATTIYDVYRKRDDGDRYLKSGLNESNTYNWSEASQADASDNYSGLSGTIGGTLASKSVTYTYSVSDLFPSGTTVRTLNYYSDPQAKEIEVEVHYYDRDTSSAQFGKPTEISSDDKKVTFTAEMTDNTLESFVANNLDRFNVTENVVDQHYFEFSQYRAVKALKEFKYYPLLDNDDKVPTTTVGEQQKYSYFFSGSYTPDGESTALPNDALNYHTSCYGIPQYDAEHCVDSTGKENPTDQEKLDARQQWVTFYNGTTVLTNINFQEDIDNAEITSITSANSTNDLSNVTKIVIWAFNAPKTYTFEAHYTKETTDQEENVVYPTFTEGTNKVTLNDNSTVYIDMSAAEPISGFYNQRVGSEDTREGLSAALKDSINGGTEYLKAYGIENAYFGGSEVSIEAAEKANLTGSDTILKFDAWYIKDSDGFHRLSTQRSYENRVMNDLIIYAGYVPSDETTDSVGVAITENETDRYIDTDNVEKVRYNTLVNVFGNGVTESDEHIVNAASVYVYLPQYDTDGHYIDWTDPQNKAAISEAFANPETKNKIREDVVTHLTKLEKARTTAGLTDNSVGNYYHTYSTPATEVSIVVNDVTISTQGTGAKIDCFDFKIVSDNASAANHQLTLTNKNRVQFSMIMLADDYDTKPFLAFVAIKYSKDGSSQWYVSDNFVSNLIDTDPSVKKN